ncbi:MAG: SiaB family protein kinase [Bacteroidetes bacterium]|nr:SiaB family protein kinase [Bacteroidota bacterium]
MKDNLSNHSCLEFVFEICRNMNLNEISLVYEGQITHQLIKAFTSLTETNMEKAGESNAVQRKVFHVMVEGLQNISKHADAIDKLSHASEGRGIFMICKSDDKYNVITGNLIENEKIPRLKVSIEMINVMTSAELKETYKKQIGEGSLSERGGAGLGLIDIVRKTGHPLAYHFIRIDDLYSLFILISTVARNL